MRLDALKKHLAETPLEELQKEWYEVEQHYPSPNAMQRVYVDMDDTLCNFTGARKEALKKVPGQQFPQAQMDFFRKLEPIDDAISSILTLATRYDVWILTRPSYINPLCYTEKRLWVEDHLGLEWCNKLILCPDKSLLKGDILIDDVEWPEFEGDQILFGQGMHATWEGVIKNLMPLPK